MEIIKSGKELVSKIKNAENEIFIYGNAKRAEHLFGCIKTLGFDCKVKGAIVTNKIYDLHGGGYQMAN